MTPHNNKIFYQRLINVPGIKIFVKTFNCTRRGEEGRGKTATNHCSTSKIEAYRLGGIFISFDRFMFRHPASSGRVVAGGYTGTLTLSVRTSQ